jgi:uncharacterized iron-regulated protein
MHRPPQRRTPLRPPPFAIAAALAGILTTAAARAPAAVLIFGEQHDQPDQQRQVADEVRDRAAAGTLAAVVLEMADRGRDTRGLPPDAGEAQVREALAWNGWPWEAYAAVVMNAVRARVPVHGGNLPRGAMRDAMRDETLDAQVTDGVRALLAREVRDGHCGMLPASQEPGMVRIQIARDRAMAATVAALAADAGGRDVLLLTGAQHASRDRGVPLHLPPALPLRVVMFGAPVAGLVADEWRAAAVTPRPDACEQMREQLQRREGGR